MGGIVDLTWMHVITVLNLVLKLTGCRPMHSQCLVSVCVCVCVLCRAEHVRAGSTLRTRANDAAADSFDIRGQGETKMAAQNSSKSLFLRPPF